MVDNKPKTKYDDINIDSIIERLVNAKINKPIK